MIIDDLFEASQSCPHCGGPMFSEMLMMEKKDACYYKVKASAKVWPSAYASGRLVQCRKKGAGNYGNKSEGVMEMDKSQTPPGRDGSNDSDAGKKEYTAKPTTAKKVAKDGEKILNKELNKKQGVAEGSESDAYGNTGEKHECGSCDGTGIDTHDDECPECGGKGWVRDKESLKKKGVAEDQLDEKSTSQAQFRTMAAAAHNPEFAKKVGISRDVAKEFHGADRKQDYADLPKKADEGKSAPKEKEADYGDDYQAMVARVKKLAGLGPLKTVYDPTKRVYRNVPTAVQPKK